jgi:PAS domain S-box-containing protein
VDLSEYAFEPLRADEELALYRGRPRTQSAPSRRPILLLRAVCECPAPATLERLEHESSLASELQSGWAARPIALTENQGRTALVLEDPGGEPLNGLVGAPMELGLFLRLAIGLASSLGELHARGIIHKDVKPANALVDTATGRAWLTGFGIASRLRRERQAPEPPEVIAGSLPYMSPEQTGRMNRSIDSRSDLYAAGVTLYEMSTATLPFDASDPMEWVHSHIARRPVPPAERRKEIPGPVSAIIVKLLAKTPEDRYQTAVGLERDLRRCLAAWDRDGRVDDFRLGEDDTPDRLRVPEKLYGRSREVETLLGAFDRMVTSGRPELVLVSGYSGVGKSSVVNELHKSLAPRRGLFAWGKCERYKRDGPFPALAQALERLIQSLLGKSEAELAHFRDSLREALGTNGKLMVDLVPKLELVIGEQPKVAELPAHDAQRRFQFVFRRFIAVFARPEHPLALFLDDLQWLDAATLDLLEDVFTRLDLRHLLVIGAYRDNEVTPAHPLMLKLQALRDAGTPVQEIKLAPLARQDVDELVADALRCELARAAPLAELVYGKTAGNPFFLIQFIRALLDEGLLEFDHRAGRWSWDLEGIHAKGYTSNVADLLAGKLTRLPVRAQETLQQLACLGSSAATARLALVRGTSEEQVHADLGEAVCLELIERFEGAYRFVHDRIQEAAYSLIPEPLRAAAHLRIGRWLKANTPAEGGIFEIVDQLNRGIALISSPDEREELAQLNMIAGKRAKDATAYVSARTYLEAGRALLPEDSWDRCATLTFSIELHLAECECLTCDYATAEERLLAISKHAPRLLDLANVTRLQEELFATLGRSDRAVEACLGYLRHAGVQWSAQPTEEQVQQEYERIWLQIGSRSVEELVDLPLMTDCELRGTMDVLNAVLPTALWTNENLFCLVVCRMANLSLEHGNSDGSCFAYVCLGMLLGRHFGNYPAGFSFGRLGLDLVEQRDLRGFEGRVDLVFGSCVVPWTQPIRNGRGLVRRAFEVATRLGDFTYAGYSRNLMITNLLATGESLEEVQREAEAGLEFARQVHYGFVVDIITGQLRLIRTLRGLTPEFASFNDAGFDERRFEQHLAEDPGLKIVAGWYWVLKLQARFLAGEYAAAAEAAENARQFLWASPTSFQLAEFQLYAALAQAALFDTAPAADRPRHLDALVAHHRQLQEWAGNCPANFEDRAELAGAELARIEGRDAEAMRLYERAIAAARANGFVHNEALASELAARFYVARGVDRIAQVYLREARNGYLRWGAEGKVRQLERLHPQLCGEQPPPDARRTIGAPLEHLDLATVLKVSQAVSGEIVLEKLIDKLLCTAIEHAGAERGLLVLPYGGDLSIEAEANTNGETVAVKHLRGTPIAGSELPESIARYAARTQENVILDDASASNPFSADPYVRERRARSVLCLPLVKQGRLVALLYLENSLAPNVFTPARTAVLRVLASQAAMALENSRLYRELQEREAKIRRLVDANIVGVLISNLDGRVIEANNAYLDMVGCTHDDLVSGRVKWMDLTPPEWMEVSQRGLEQLRATGTMDLVEKEYLLKDGSRVPILIAAALITPTQAVAFVVDLRERKAAEEALVRAREELAHVTRVSTVGELAASIAHEINQPLAAVATYAAAALLWLLHDPPNFERAREALQHTIHEGERAGKIVSRVRALVKKAPPRTEAVDIDEVILEVLDLSRNELRRNGISIRTQLAAGKPLVRGDRIQLQQLVLNLILNAVDAMSEPGTSPRKLTIASRRGESNQVLVEVRDSGRGFLAETMERIFDPFFTTKIDGMGMGLSISRSIVVAHGGRLWATANQPRGAVFQFALPAVESEISVSHPPP